MEYRGFCADLHHPIAGGTDYAVSLRTAADDATLGSARSAEAAWLLQQAEALIAAAPTASKALEAGALQVAVWQLAGQARETTPTCDAALNARAAAIRALAAGRAVGGPLTATPAMPRGCAGRSAVALRLTGTPGSTAKLSVTAGAGAVSPAQVRFAADGTADASVTSALAGTRHRHRPRRRAARSPASPAPRPARPPRRRPLVLTRARTYEASATVVFENCPLIPSGGDGPTTPPPPRRRRPDDPGIDPGHPVRDPVLDAAPPRPRPRPDPADPNQTTPRLSLTKTGPGRPWRARGSATSSGSATAAPRR